LVQALVGVLVGYLAGAIPTGAVVGRLGGVDLTQVGSRRTGATNVLRTLGPGAAAVVFLGDMLKGTLAMLLVGVLFDRDPWGVALAGIAAVFGHAYSLFIGFKGGRGVTTGLGGLAVLWPPAAGLALLVGAVAIAATRYVSLGSILGTVVGTLALLAGVFTAGLPPAYAAFAVVVGVFIVAAHHDNIQRLRQGTERKLGQRVERT
jgi:glycerol-3-phosphate acyltransferase PlsY